MEQVEPVEPSICIDCSMCCDGTMYRTVDIEAGEDIAPLQAAAVAFTVEAELTSFLQPCSAFCHGSCSIYDGRPSVCRKYRCALLRRVDAGEVAYDEARKLIANATAIRDRVRHELERLVQPQEPLALDGLYKPMFARWESATDRAAMKKAQSRLILDITALRVLLSRYFEPRDSESHKAEETKNLATKFIDFHVIDFHGQR
ncbi:MAG: YkgJ family cysteine cluster protein [Holophagaceae bacterium]|nr:YkgJ family cysteine cluster protein [Holophagaceae bacterium]